VSNRRSTIFISNDITTTIIIVLTVQKITIISMFVILSCMPTSGSRTIITTSVLLHTHYQRYQHGLFAIIIFINSNIINFATLAHDDYIIINKLSYMGL